MGRRRRPSSRHHPLRRLPRRCFPVRARLLGNYPVRGRDLGRVRGQVRGQDLGQVSCLGCGRVRGRRLASSHSCKAND